MTIQLANAIVQRIGPCRIALDRVRHADLAVELALLGCDTAPEDGQATARIVDWPLPPDADPQALRPHAQQTDLVVLATRTARRPIEETLFAQGWGRHPAGMIAHEYPGWTTETLPETTFYRRAPGARVQAGLLDRGDMLADAAIARFAMAAQSVRSGDRVLVDAAEAVAGAAILAALSRAGEILTDAHGLDDHGIDLVIAIDPPGVDWAERCADYSRLLAFDGRVILGTSGDARAREGLRAAGDVHFLPEALWTQHLGDGDAPYLATASLDSAGDDGAAMLLVAAANPLLGEAHRAGYRHRGFQTGDAPPPVIADFGAAYDNPYLYRAMVQMGERLGDEVLLARLAECVIEDAPEASADRGAAIAVLGYRVLEMRLLASVPQITALIDAYRAANAADASPPHVARWCVSLAFLAGRLSELAGDRAAAIHWYRLAATGDWTTFSPLLATKGIAAAFYEARLHLSAGDEAAAASCLRHGVAIAVQAATFPHAELMGPADHPLPFYLQEMAEVMDMGSQCATALAHLALWRRAPGLFWRQVDTRRFGLASWARDLERENARLRGQG